MIAQLTTPTATKVSKHVQYSKAFADPKPDIIKRQMLQRSRTTIIIGTEVPYDNGTSLVLASVVCMKKGSANDIWLIKYYQHGKLHYVDVPGKLIRDHLASGVSAKSVVYASAEKVFGFRS